MLGSGRINGVVGCPLPIGPTGRSKRARGPFCQNLCPALEPDSTERQLKGYRQAESFSDSWKSYRSVFEDDSSHQQVGKSSGELAHVERFFGRLRQKLTRYAANTNSLRVRANAPLDDATVRGVAQPSRHLTSIFYPKIYEPTYTPVGAPARPQKPLTLCCLSLHVYFTSSGRAVTVDWSSCQLP